MRRQQHADRNERLGVMNNRVSGIPQASAMRTLLAVSLASMASGCMLAPTGGVTTPTCDDACLQQRAVDETAAAAARAASAAEAARIQDLITKRADALRALNNAISDFIHRSPPGSMSAPNSSIADWAHELADLRTRMQNAPLDQVQEVYDIVRSQLDGAYAAAVRAGMFDPHTIGQQSASDTWWYISS